MTQIEEELVNCCPNCGSTNIRIADLPKDKPVEVMKCDACRYSWDEKNEESRPLYHEGDKGDKLTELQINGALSLEYQPDLDAVIFDMMCENENPPDKETLQKWIDQFPQFERELRGFVKGWRLMERVQGDPVTDEEVNEVEAAFQLDKKYPGMFKWGRIRKCDVCGKSPAALCFDGVRRCLTCINRAFPERINQEML